MTGSIVVVPGTEETALFEEAHRVAAELSGADGTSTRVVGVAFDGLTAPAALSPGAPDEVVHVARENGEAFRAGAAGVRARATALAAAVSEPRVVLLPDTPDGTDLAAATARIVSGPMVGRSIRRS